MPTVLPPISPDNTRRLALGWAAFVACSWTWCIGMYLPVLLVRDFGVAGWFVFTIPNVIGAAAMGWVLQSPGSAAELARRHWPAAVLFSLVTILFHAFFVGWIVRPLIGDMAEVTAITAAIGFYLLGRRGRADLPIAGVLLSLSLIAFVVAASLPRHAPVGPAGIRPGAGLLYLSPVIVFGFLLCPYLDLTFLRAGLQRVPTRESPHSPSALEFSSWPCSCSRSGTPGFCNQADWPCSRVHWPGSSPAT